MPSRISSESFEHGDVVATAEVLDLLRSDAEHAYPPELIRMTLATEFGFTMDEILLALANLTNRGSVESKKIRWETYYRYVRPSVGFRTGRTV